MASLVPNLYKVCLIGNSGVGKTSIFNSIRGKEFSKEPKAETNTCSLSYVVNGEDGQDINVTLQLWDTAGQERWESLTESYYRDAKAVIIVFSVDCPESFKSVYRHIQHIMDKDYSPNALYFLVGNKIDLNRDEVSKAQINDCKMSYPGVLSNYTRTSAKENTNIRELFEDVAQTLVSRQVRPVERGNGFQLLYNTPENQGFCSGC